MDHQAQETPQPGGEAAPEEQPQAEAPPDLMVSQRGLQEQEASQLGERVPQGGAIQALDGLEQDDIIFLVGFSGEVIGYPQAELECARPLLQNASPPTLCLDYQAPPWHY